MSCLLSYNLNLSSSLIGIKIPNVRFTMNKFKLFWFGCPWQTRTVDTAVNSRMLSHAWRFIVNALIDYRNFYMCITSPQHLLSTNKSFILLLPILTYSTNIHHYIMMLTRQTSEICKVRRHHEQRTQHLCKSHGIFLRELLQSQWRSNHVASCKASVQEPPLPLLVLIRRIVPKKCQALFAG